MSYDVLIIGGGPAGLSAAINVRARGRSVLVVSNPMEDSPLWRAEVIQNYLGLPGVTGPEMLETFHRHAVESGVEFREGKALTSMYLSGKWYVTVGSDVVDATAVVLAAGVARGRKFPGEEDYLGKGVSYCATCDGMLYRQRPVVVAGYTDTSKREAQFLESIDCQVTYLDRPRNLTVVGDQEFVTGVEVNGEKLEAEGVFILRPSVAPTELFPGLEVADGYVAVDRQMKTNLEGLFAAGDCTGGPLQVSKAVGEGLIAGQQAAMLAAKAANA